MRRREAARHALSSSLQFSPLWIKMQAAVTIWPLVETAYTDEFGRIEPEVYAKARALWGQAERFALATLGDGPAGLQLMIKAVAIVSRVQVSQPGKINNLGAYLFQTYKRLVLAELEKENGHRRRETERSAEMARVMSSGTTAVDVDRKILVEQLMGRMDEWTREVFELLVLGHTFEEIGQDRGQSVDALRSKFNKQLKRLMKQVTAETAMSGKGQHEKSGLCSCR